LYLDSSFLDPNAIAKTIAFGPMGGQGPDGAQGPQGPQGTQGVGATQVAVRGYREVDYTDATPNRWGTFVYVDSGVMPANSRVLVCMNITYKAPFSCYTYFRLRDGPTGYDQAGTVRTIMAQEIPNAVAIDFYTVSIMAFFDIPDGENHRICCDVKASNNNGTVTVFGSDTVGPGACELKLYKIGEYT